MPKDAESQLVLPFKPPFLVLILVVLGCIIQFIYPIEIWDQTIPRIAIGSVLMMLGGALMGASSKAFKVQGEHFSHAEKTSAVVNTGPFRFSRNPVYLAMMIIIAGLAIASNIAWILITFHLIGVLALHFLVVLPEEKYLRSTLGSDYDEYCNEVRRWL
jgi:protein-S-isoprenylcysteine O-methyltransferase Ste14